MKLPPKLLESVAQSLNTKIAHYQPVGGGDISHAGVIATLVGDLFFLKWNAQAPEGFFRAEAAGLSELARCEALTVPNVIAYADQPESNPAWILLEHLTPGEKTEAKEEELGRMLAALHQVKSDAFGFSADNFIGLTPQQNQRISSWPDFFFSQRILPQVQIGSEAGWFDLRFDKLLQEKEATIRIMLAEARGTPSLLHGDLWSGNVFFTEESVALIDPAVYYGHREADLAMTELFGGFSKRFYDAYNEALPLDSGYAARKNLYNLYHLMNHANLFSGDYVGRVWATLSRL